MASDGTQRGTILHFSATQSEEIQVDVVAHMSVLTIVSSFYLLKMIYGLE